jgi:hypothetical protein
MIKEFLIEKYGTFVTNSFLTIQNEVIYDNLNKDGVKEQEEVIKVLKALKNSEGENLVPDTFLSKNVQWGFDFSSWIGGFDKKEFFFIGSEPHIENNYQLVYDFGNYKGRSLTESAKQHYEKENDIWYYLTNTFINELNEKNITEFLSKCYITDLCHIVPKHCGQVKDICKKLDIKPGEWKRFRNSVAQRFLLKEIEAVNPKYVILHGNSAREFFQNTLGMIFTSEYKIDNSKYSIKFGNFYGYQIISIPHLKGDVRNKLWKCKKYPERTASAKKILFNLVNYSEIEVQAG